MGSSPLMVPKISKVANIARLSLKKLMDLLSFHLGIYERSYHSCSTGAIIHGGFMARCLSGGDHAISQRPVVGPGRDRPTLGEIGPIRHSRHHYAGNGQRKLLAGAS